jgi:hypothetical protein
MHCGVLSISSEHPDSSFSYIVKWEWDSCVSSLNNLSLVLSPTFQPPLLQAATMLHELAVPDLKGRKPASTF